MLGDGWWRRKRRRTGGTSERDVVKGEWRKRSQ